jgi:hypothetical protein
VKCSGRTKIVSSLRMTHLRCDARGNEYHVEDNVLEIEYTVSREYTPAWTVKSTTAMQRTSIAL